MNQQAKFLVSDTLAVLAATLLIREVCEFNLPVVIAATSEHIGAKR
ncbi:MAG TPA: hypothetical protein VE619_12000 [Nitrososphaeraceae archaeon]|nr:hypothetical protein [Nitrososphaeraceae archaeon]